MLQSTSEIVRLPALCPPPPAVASRSAPASSAIPRCRRSCLPVPIHGGLAFREAQICPRGIPARIRLRRLLRQGEVPSSQPGVSTVAYKWPRHPSTLKLRPSSPLDLRTNQRRLPPRDRRGQIQMAPATWIDETTHVFLQVCAEEVEAHNRPFSRLNTQGKQNLLRKFEERTGLQYTSKQMKHKWEQLSRDYNKWKTLKLRATGLGVDPSTGSIDASDDWWAAAGGGKFEMRKFRAIVANDEDLLEVVFGNTTTTSECAFVPGVDDLDVDTDDLDESPGGEGSSMPSPMQAPASGVSGRTFGSKRPCPAPLHPRSCRAIKRTECDVNFKRLVDLYESQLSMQSGSRGSGTSVTSPTLDPIREDVHQLMTLVEEAGAHEGTDEHYYTSQLFMKLECRNSFSMRTNEGRLNWIRRTWERRGEM